MRNTEETSKQLDELYYELEVAQTMSEEAVCSTFNVDSKKEHIDLLNDEIDRLEDLLREDEDMGSWEEQEKERTMLCISQGISRYC